VGARALTAECVAVRAHIVHPVIAEMVNQRHEIIAMTRDIPHNVQTITPYFTVRDAVGLLEFIVSAFDAQIVRDNRYSDNTIQHARVRIGDSIIMMNEGSEEYPANISQVHLYVDDVNRVFSRALEAGATTLMEPDIRPHGDMMAGIRDPNGNVWWIATPSS